jgi:hypothetical protein
LNEADKQLDAPMPAAPASNSDPGHVSHDTPPLARPVGRAAPRPRATRLAASLTLIGCASVLAIAAYLEPDPRGFGTHEQLLSSGPCGMLVLTGLPCPTCGMTTAFAYTVRGQWLQAMWAQPTGFLLALGTIALLGISAWTIVRGRWPQLTGWWLTPYRLFMTLLILLLGGWAFKIVVGLSTGTLPYR